MNKILQSDIKLVFAILSRYPKELTKELEKDLEAEIQNKLSAAQAVVGKDEPAFREIMDHVFEVMVFSACLGARESVIAAIKGIVSPKEKRES